MAYLPGGRDADDGWPICSLLRMAATDSRWRRMPATVEAKAEAISASPAATAPPVRSAVSLPERLWRGGAGGDGHGTLVLHRPIQFRANLAFLDSLRGGVLLVVLYHTWIFSGEPHFRLGIPGTGGTLDPTAILCNGSAGI